MKRIFCMLLVAAMLLSFLPAVSLQAAAAGSTEEIGIIAPTYFEGQEIPEAAEISVLTENCAVVDIYGFYSGDLSETATGTFAGGEGYWLLLTVEAPEGAPFTQSPDVSFDGVCEVTVSEDGTTAELALLYSFMSNQANYIYIDGMPEEIAVGNAEIPELSVSSEATVKDICWVDEDRQVVTAFAENESYYLKVTLQAAEGVSFGDYIDFEDVRMMDDYEIVSSTEAVFYRYYSLLPDAGEIRVITAGIGEGLPISGVTATVTGNAVLGNIGVIDATTWEPVETGVFEHGHVYSISFVLHPAEGYRFGNDTNLEVNDGGYDWYTEEEELGFGMYLNTMDKVESVALTVTKPAVGKKLTDVNITVPANANYTVESASWTDPSTWEEVTGTFANGKRYRLDVELVPKDGYAFSQDALSTVNGKADDSFWTNESGSSAYVALEYSFMTEITKVELPAMPTAIQKNKTLPVESVSGKNYTLSVYWSTMDGEEKTVADEDGIYLLVWSAEVKDGYEFTDDTKFYIGGKEVRPLERGWRDGQFIQSYSIGIPTVDRVDLICAEPKVGKKPPAVSVPADAQYDISQVSWGQSAIGDWYAIEEDAEILQAGLYTYAYGMVMVPEGMALDEDVTFYIGGQEFEPVAMYNFGQYAIVMFGLGKLGEIEKLTAPALSKEENVLSWNAVLNATGYEIYRATSKSGKYTKMATVTDTAWQDSVTAGKTYYYKVRAVYSADSSKNSGYSNVVSIVYKCDAPVIEAVNGSTGKPVISWEKVNGAKKYTVYRATAVDGKYTKLGTTTKLTYTDSKAKSGVEYFYKIIANASSSTYNSSYSNIYMCYVICGTPSVTAKADAATGKPGLSWKKAEGAVSYRIFRQLPGEAEFTCIATQTGVTFTDTTAPIDTVCRYYVQAAGQHEMLDGAYSETVTVTAGIARPAVQAAVDAASGKPVFTWEAVEGAVKYEVYRSTKSTKSYSLLTTVEGTSFVDDSVSAGKTYYYKLVAVGENCKSAETAYVKLTGKCATATITVANGSTGKPVISWEKVNGAKKYTVYRATSETGKYSKLGTTTKLSYTDSKAKSGVEYFYKIIANASSSKYNSGYSNAVSCNVICATPAVTVKVDAATGKPSLSWKKAEGAVSYRIFRQLPGEAEFTCIATQTGVTFTDTTAPIDTVCRYYVQAAGQHEMLDGAYSETVTVTAGIARPAVQAAVDATSGKPVFTWEAVEGAVKYEVYRSTKSTKSYSLLTTVEGTSFVDESVSAGKTYYYKLVAVGENCKSAETAYVKLTGKCAAPQISIALHETSGKPVLSWEKVTGAKKYTVYRATSETGKYTKLGTTTKLTYTDSKAVPGTEYYYKVVANGSKSSYNSNYSNVKAAVGYAAQPQVTLKNDSKGKPVVSWKKISEAEKYIVVYVDITDVENESDVTEQFILDHMQYVEVSKKKTGITLSQAQTGRIYMVCVVAMPKNEGFFAISQPGYVAALCAAPKISGKYIQGYNCGTWKAVEGAEYYAIYRSTKASGDYVLLGYIDNDSSFVDLSAVKGKTYYYKVTACTEYTESEFSNYIKLKTK